MKELLAIIFLAFAGSVPGQTNDAASIESGAKAYVSTEAKDALKDFDFNKLAIDPNNLTEKNIEALRDNFFAGVKPYLLDKGAYVTRLARIAGPVILFHKSGKSRTVVFDHKLPTVFTWKETFITFSTSAMDVLTDDEIAALIAHEIGHLYFAGALAQAREQKNDRAARVIELKCDLIALVTLSKLNIKPSNLISAVKKLIQARSKLPANAFEPGSPSLESREEVYKLFLSIE
jgi:hypothetical protein